MYHDTGPVGPDIDLDEFISELKTPWKTMAADMETVFEIIGNCTDAKNDPGRLELICLSAEQHSLSVIFPAWQATLERTFVNQYGLTGGKLIFNKVIMRLYQMSKGTEQYLH